MDRTIQEQRAKMLPLYLARVGDLEQGDFVNRLRRLPSRGADDAGGPAQTRAEPRRQGARSHDASQVPRLWSAGASRGFG
jgi:hypothetical protein